MLRCAYLHLRSNDADGATCNARLLLILQCIGRPNTVT